MVSMSVKVKVRLDSESLPILTRGSSGMPLKQRTEKRNVLIAHCETDLLQRSMVALQHPLRRGDPQLLQVDQRAVTRSLLETPHKVPHAHAHALRRIFERKCLREILVNPVLRFRD